MVFWLWLRTSLLSHYSNAKMRCQSFFILDHRPAVLLRLVRVKVPTLVSVLRI
jgi:hypothetical protein